MAVFNLIQHTELSGTAASFDKTSIPSSYDHLYFVASARLSVSSHLGSCNLTFNNTGGSSYGVTSMYAGSTSPASGESTGHSAINYIYLTGNSVQSDSFGTIEIWVPNYANTSNYTQALIQWGFVGSSSTNLEWLTGQTSGLFMDTGAINQLTFDANGNDFMQYSTFTLYGVNGAG
tara:strand:- start:464 stop:991 length:528 start_codon:yes stop_codon:yes gene_type:complete